MEPPSDATPSPGQGEPHEERPPAAWTPPDAGRPDFAPHEPLASWPAAHTYPAQPSPEGPPPSAQGPGYLLPGQSAPGHAAPGVIPPGSAPYGQMEYGQRAPGYTIPGTVGGPAQPWATGAPPGTPFHQLDRTARHHWWRPLLGTVVLLLEVLAAGIAVFTIWIVVHWAVTGELVEPTEKHLVGGPLEDLALQLVLLGVLIPLAPLTALVFSRRPAWSVASVLNRLRWRWLGVCALAALAYVALSLVCSAIVTAAFTDEPLVSDWVGWGRFWGPALVILLLVPFQSTAEELLFRGWLLQAVGGCTLRRHDGTYRNAFTGALGRVLGTPWPAIAISSALFVAGHGYRGWAMLDIFIWALACGWLAVRTGGLEASIALHVLNNLMAFGLTAAAGELEESLQQGAAPWYYLLADLPPLAVFVALVLWLGGRRRVETVTPG